MNDTEEITEEITDTDEETSGSDNSDGGDGGDSGDSGDSGDNTAQFVTAQNENGLRLDVVLAARLPDLSRSQVQKLIGGDFAKVNSRTAKTSQKVFAGDVLQINVPAPRPSHSEAENIALDIVYEDADLIVVNKPKNMVVHPAPGVRTGTLVNALLFHGQHGNGLSSVGGVLRPGIVHRLDKNTTGLLMVAKTDKAHHALQAQIQARTAERRYQTVVWGIPPWKEAVVDAPLQRHLSDRTRMAVGDGNDGKMPSRLAVTDLFVKETFGEAFALLECKLHTGRTHQIRVHCQFAGFPVVGDTTYDKGVKQKMDGLMHALTSAKYEAILTQINHLQGQLLHAFSLSFDQPTTGRRLSFTVPPPHEMHQFLLVLRNVL